MEKEYCYRGSDSDLKPVKCEIITKFGFPNLCITEEGNTERMYNNLHFRTEKQAWESIVQSVNAGYELANRAIDTAKEEIEKAKNKLERAEKDMELIKYEMELVRTNPENPYRDKVIKL